jgi:hypothetical protein
LHGFILLPTLPPIGFGTVIMALNGVFMRFDANDNVTHNVIFEKEGGEIFVSINTLLRINVASVSARLSSAACKAL